MNISGWLPFYISELYINFECVTSRRVDRFDSVLPRPDHFQLVLISSPACALIRFCGTILISMPIGHWMRTIFGLIGRYRYGCCFIRRRIGSWFFHATNLAFLLPRSACIVSMIYGWLFTRIASSKVPFLTSLRSDRAFQAVRDLDVELALFYSYHLDRFGHSVAASPANR